MPTQKSNVIVDPRDPHFKYLSLINEAENIIWKMNTSLEFMKNTYNSCMSGNETT